jgi:hypothetical protein
MGWYSRLALCVTMMLACFSFGCGCERRARALEGAYINVDARQPENVLNALSFLGEEKPPYFYAWSTDPHSKNINGVLYHGWALYESTIPRKEAIRRAVPPRDERQAVASDSSRRLVEIYAHRSEEPERRVDIRLSSKVEFMLQWNLKKVVVRNAQTGKALAEGALMEAPEVDLEEGSMLEERALLLTVVMPPGEYHLQASKR